MNQGRISRGGEKALGIIGIIFNLLTIALLVYMITSFGQIQGTPQFEQFEEEMRNDPSLGSPEDAQMVIDTLTTSIGPIGWTLVVLLAISTIFAILALLNLRKDKNAKLAGAFFIIAGLFAGILSLTSILFYIAAIMCFVRKAKPGRDDYSNPNDRNRYNDGRGGNSDDVSHHKDHAENRGTDAKDRTEDAIHDKEDTPYRPL
ncbi:DUF4064 domain-containing protein [Planococcus sp. YIM B11945]|uniref:DUF4064 domain-containing protein n=1 Tax=Planococcus sp. YIM B11945 TaxID=3435410 RepID=UPI003D7E3C4F